jgi:hypothetical protein
MFFFSRRPDHVTSRWCFARSYVPPFFQSYPTPRWSARLLRPPPLVFHSTDLNDANGSQGDADDNLSLVPDGPIRPSAMGFPEPLEVPPSEVGLGPSAAAVSAHLTDPSKSAGHGSSGNKSGHVAYPARPADGSLREPPLWQQLGASARGAGNSNGSVDSWTRPAATAAATSSETAAAATSAHAPDTTSLGAMVPPVEARSKAPTATAAATDGQAAPADAAGESVAGTSGGTSNGPTNGSSHGAEATFHGVRLVPTNEVPTNEVPTNEVPTNDAVAAGPFSTALASAAGAVAAAAPKLPVPPKKMMRSIGQGEACGAMANEESGPAPSVQCPGSGGLLRPFADRTAVAPSPPPPTQTKLRSSTGAGN